LNLNLELPLYFGEFIANDRGRLCCDFLETIVDFRPKPKVARVGGFAKSECAY